MRRTCLWVAALFTALRAALPIAVEAAPPSEVLYQGTEIATLSYDGSTYSDDLYACDVPVGFAFVFYGVAHEQMCVSNNGYLTFDGGIATTTVRADHPSAWANTALDTPQIALEGGGSPTEIYTMIAPFWDDLVSRTDQQYVLYATIGEAPNREFVLQWTNYAYYDGVAPMGTFQVILYEADGAIRFQYRQLMWTRATGNSAAIGVRRDATVNTQYWQMGTALGGDDATANDSSVTGPLTAWQSILWSWDGTSYAYDDGAEYEGTFLYRTTPPPLAQDLVSPPADSTVAVRPTLCWDASDPGASYRVRVATDPSMVDVVVDETLPGTCHTPTDDLILGQRYYWVVTALGGWGETWSEERSFITGETTVTTLSYSPIPALAGETVTLTAVVTSEAGVPTGSVAFRDGNLPLGTVALDDGSASIAVPNLATGTHAIAADYSGDSNFALSGGTLSLPVVNSVTVYNDGFAGAADGRWSTASTSTPACGGTAFLGEFGAETVTLALDSLPVHSYVTVSFELLILRSWDGNQLEWPGAITLPVEMLAAEATVGPDEWRLRADGTTLLDTTFTNWPSFTQAFPGEMGSAHLAQDGARTVNSMCYTFGPYAQDAVYSLTFTFGHSGESLALEFSAIGLSDLSDESWGLDNVQVVVAGSPEWQTHRLYVPLARGG